MINKEEYHIEHTLAEIELAGSPSQTITLQRANNKTHLLIVQGVDTVVIDWRAAMRISIELQKFILNNVISNRTAQPD